MLVRFNHPCKAACSDQPVTAGPGCRCYEALPNLFTMCSPVTAFPLAFRRNVSRWRLNHLVNILKLLVFVVCSLIHKTPCYEHSHNHNIQSQGHEWEQVQTVERLILSFFSVYLILKSCNWKPDKNHLKKSITWPYKIFMNVYLSTAYEYFASMNVW